MIYIKRDPASDPRISPEERTYIECNLENSNDKKNIRTPWKPILTSSAVIAITIVNFCDTWSSIIFQTEIPTFLNDVLKYDLGHTGIIAAAPYLMYIIVVFVVSPLSDFIRSRNILTTQQVRKIFIASGFLVTACLLSFIANLKSATAVSTSLIIAIGLTAITRTTYL